MAANIFGKMLNVIGIENEPADEAQYDEYAYEEEPEMRRNSSKNTRDDRDSRDSRDRDYDRYESSYRGGNYDGDYSSGSDYEDTSYRRSYDSKIISHPSAAAPRHRMMIYQLATYEDARDVIDDLLEEHSVLINLESLGLEDAQRIIDTLIGACYAINATIKKAAQQTYLLAPESVEIAGTYAEENRQRTIY